MQDAAEPKSEEDDYGPQRSSEEEADAIIGHPHPCGLDSIRCVFLALEGALRLCRVVDNGRPIDGLASPQPTLEQRFQLRGHGDEGEERWERGGRGMDG